ncbi:MAG: hypothetical protein QG623_421 [Patescibacteria group bacterium]|nr:hypothetical protein [Patescibacteria group bacterium]MDQ5913802.1 hypothetical protein [Patescibacteria group bacterium]
MADKSNKNWFAQHKVLTVILALFAIGIVATAAGGGSKGGSSSKSSSGGSSSKAEPAKVGQPANDGKFEFTVKSVECGKASVGSNQYLTKTAQGQYCLLNVSVKNVGDQAQSLASSNQYLLNASGQKYSADDVATMYNTPNGSSWYNDINPGNSVEGAIVFDIPKDQTPVTAELHDSAFSRGVKVNLQ